MRVVMALAFYPRGGSAQVARYLSQALVTKGLDVTLCCGSLGPAGATSHAATFFAGLDVQALDFTSAVSEFEQGRDPMAAPVPMHPSFEDRPGVPDRVFAALGEADYRHQVAVWRSLLEGAGPCDVYHVHHLTHVNEAVAALGATPVVAHLHGTELKMLAAIGDGGASWPHASEWERRLRTAARRASCLIVVSEADRTLAGELLGIGQDSIELVPNGVDTARFDDHRLPPGERLARWQRWLVEEPQGWDETGEVGSIRYSARQLRAGFLDGEGGPLPVLLYVGRFLSFKRVPLLVRAYAKARAVLGPSAPPLVIWGGYPGEWEDEHPHAVATSLGVDGVFFAGWRGHDELVTALNCADVFVAPSVDEPFGQVYLEAMASGLPVIATASGGPRSFVNTDPARPNGWLVAPDAEDELVATLVAAATDATERQRRGGHGRELVERDFDWRRIAERFEQIYRAAV